MILILFFGGCNLLAISIIGEYLGKVLEESKQRPKFIRKSIFAFRKYFEDEGEIAEFLDQRKKT
jgi:dolichol-phosphate mannosyltransferase